MGGEHCSRCIKFTAAAVISRRYLRKKLYRVHCRCIFLRSLLLDERGGRVPLLRWMVYVYPQPGLFFTVLQSRDGRWSSSTGNGTSIRANSSVFVSMREQELSSSEQLPNSNHRIIRIQTLWTREEILSTRFPKDNGNLRLFIHRDAFAVRNETSSYPKQCSVTGVHFFLLYRKVTSVKK